MRVVVIRHTETDWNKDGRYQGRTDIPINDIGEKQARALGEELKLLNIKKIISSDLTRAIQTARIVNEALNLPLVIDERLRESGFGEIEGHTKQEVGEKFGQEWIKHLDDHHVAYNFRPLGGEHRDDVLNRYLEVIDGLAEEHTVDTILLVAHGRGLRTLAGHMGQPPDIERGEYRVFEYPAGQ
ncbi:MAG TPA: histidine phosphatase family protein [Candidatus Paceibacterota bacterium]